MSGLWLVLFVVMLFHHHPFVSWGVVITLALTLWAVLRIANALAKEQGNAG